MDTCHDKNGLETDHEILIFNLDQNNYLCLQQIRVTHLMSNFRTFYQGNCISDVASFNMVPLRIAEHLINNH